MKNRSPFELKYQQLKKFESLKVTEKEIIEIEQCTYDTNPRIQNDIKYGWRGSQLLQQGK